MPKVIADLGLIYYAPSKKRIRYFLFECVKCGVEIKRRAHTKKPTCKSCVKRNSEKHGLYSRSLYRKYKAMIARCYTDGGLSKKHYQDKGVKVCREWLDDYFNFEKWANENGYKEGLSIERLDNNRDYSPDNCSWIDKTDQPINRGKFSNNTSGFMGVSFQKPNNRFKAYASNNGKQVYLGMYKTAEEAAKVRDKYVIDNNLGLNLNFDDGA